MSLASTEDPSLLDSTNSHFNQIYDAVHGTIDFQNFGSSVFKTRLRDILQSEFMRRLRTVKQLGFVSKNYISAEHNRYTHSLGTMKMMQDISVRLAGVGAFSRSDLPIINGLAATFPNTFSRERGHDGNVDILREHLLVAALIQDIGELPYNIATSTFLTPSRKVRERVTKSIGIDAVNCEAKIIFALEWLWHPDNSKYLQGLCLPLLAYLVSGRLPRGIGEFPGLRALRHMMDGAVDADRLDYVHRDAFHTIGVKRSPEAIIASLLYYDDDGPVFSSPGPVSDFLATRAILWSSVYLAPSNRFRIVLFSHILRDLRSQLAEGSIREIELSKDGVEYEQLRDIDDLWMDALIRKASSDGQLLKSSKAEAAAKALSDKGPPYDYFWLGGQLSPKDDGKVDFDFSIPDELFWDSYSDYQSHTLYTHRSIRVQVDHFRYLGGTANLEDCSGPFNAMLIERSSALPMPGRLLLFRPVSPGQWPIWGEIEKRIADHSLYYRLKYEDKMGLLEDFSADTRRDEGFEGNAIFISFVFDDISVVRLIAKELSRRRRKYFCLLEPYMGLGKTARANSQQAVKESGAVLLLFSQAYANKIKNDPQGNVASEVFEMMRKRAVDNTFKIVPLSLEHYRAIGNELPWIELGFTDGQPPMVGPPLRNATDEQVRAAVDELIKSLEVASARA